MSFEDALRTADDVLRQAIQGISEVIVLAGIINLDFADIRRVMGEAGPALLAIGKGRGENRAADAARAAITSPLLDVSIQGARGVLFNVVGGKNLGLQEVHLAAQVIAEVVDPDAEIVFGAAIDPELGDEVKVTVIATGFEAPSRHEERRHAVVAGEIGAADEPARGPWAELPQVDTELPAFLRRGVTAR